MADSDQDGDHFGAVETTTAATTTSGASSFSQLLFSDDDNDIIVGLNDDTVPIHSFHHYSSSATCVKHPKMLSFGGCDIQYRHHHDHHPKSEVDDGNDVVLLTPQKFGVTCSGSSSASSANNNNRISNSSNNVTVNVNTAASKSNRKRNGSGQETVHCKTKTLARTQRTSRKTKMENPTSTGQPKVRKEKLGERITALQQLVSPFGKTDTASVLHEAMGYIRFLQDQVQVLCSPYLQHQPEGDENGGEEQRKDLRSRGLCLVPMECTVHVASSNGADYWSPAMVNNFSSTKQ